MRTFIFLSPLLLITTACDFEQATKEEPDRSQENTDSPVIENQSQINPQIKKNPIPEKKIPSQDSKKTFIIKDRLITRGEAVQQFPDENFLK